METTPYLLLVVLGAALGASLIFDLAERRIPDAVTLPALAALLVLRGAGGGSAGLLAGLAGSAVALAPFLLTCAVGGVGMGDVKLMAVVGAALGYPGALRAVLLVAIAGALQALAAAARQGAVVHTLQRGLLLLRRKKPAVAVPPVTVPYGVAIAAGAVLAALLP